jgi:hypothetical protein
MLDSHTVFDNVLFGGLLILMVTGGILSVLIHLRLKKRHPAVFTEIGSPGGFLGGPINTRRVVKRYLWGKEYREMNDPYLVYLAGSLRIVAILVVAVFLLGVVKALVGGSW